MLEHQHSTPTTAPYEHTYTRPDWNIDAKSRQRLLEFSVDDYNKTR
jgi:hypothetical protein